MVYKVQKHNNLTKSLYGRQKVCYYTIRKGNRDMKELKDEKKFLTQLMDMLEQQLGPHTEVVLHDLKKDYANTIVDIRNGHITGR